MFITIEDYATVCDERELAVLQNADETIRERAERSALEEVASYLRVRYDVAKAYAAQGDDRNPYLVQIVVNVSLYYLAQRLPMKMAGAKRAELYQQAVDWLKLVGAGKSTPNLPPRESVADDGATGTSGDGFPMIMGSIPPQKYDW